MIKTYIFDYDFSKACCEFQVDLEKFTKKSAQITLDFFTWDYDQDNDPIDEVMIKYALNILHESHSYDLKMLKDNFFEGYYPVNGDYGILLTRLDEFEYDEKDLKVTITTMQKG